MKDLSKNIVLNMNKNFEKLLNFPGWGNPENSICCIGIEEAGDWSKCKFYKERQDKSLSYDIYLKQNFKIDLEESLNKYTATSFDNNIYMKWDNNSDSYKLYDNISKLVMEITNTDCN